MTDVRWDRYPSLAGLPLARSWLQVQADLGLARNTVEAYGRAVEEYVASCNRRGIAAEKATREHVAAYVRELVARPSPRLEDVTPEGVAAVLGEEGLSWYLGIGVGLVARTLVKTGILPAAALPPETAATGLPPAGRPLARRHPPGRDRAGPVDA